MYFDIEFPNLPLWIVSFIIIFIYYLSIYSLSCLRSGHICEEHNNPADFFLDTIILNQAVTTARDKNAGKCSEEKHKEIEEMHSNHHSKVAGRCYFRNTLPSPTFPISRQILHGSPPPPLPPKMNNENNKTIPFSCPASDCMIPLNYQRKVSHTHRYDPLLLTIKNYFD